MSSKETRVIFRSKSFLCRSIYVHHSFIHPFSIYYLFLTLSLEMNRNLKLVGFYWAKALMLRPLTVEAKEILTLCGPSREKKEFVQSCRFINTHLKYATSMRLLSRKEVITYFRTIKLPTADGSQTVCMFATKFESLRVGVEHLLPIARLWVLMSLCPRGGVGLFVQNPNDTDSEQL